MANAKINVTSWSFANYPAAIFDLAAILEIRIFCDASISNINQHILNYIQTKFHAFTMKCTMVSMIRCTTSVLPKEEFVIAIEKASRGMEPDEGEVFRNEVLSSLQCAN